MTDFIQTDIQDRILRVRINRPERKNALNHAMYTGLAEALEQAEADPAIRCTLLAGHSDCFTAGNDLSDFAEGLPGEFASTPVGRFLFALANAEKPVVAAVNGPAVGIGTTMLLHCDLVYAGRNTRFQMPFANLGLCPEGASSLLLPMWLGRVRAAELLMLGDAFEVEHADRLGLINRICDPEQTETDALQACQRLAAQPPAAIRATKALLNRPNKDDLKAALLAEGELFGERLKSDEAAEAFRAFQEKRKPDFSHFG
ncbi:enoyl-CoA hydratase [Marinobacter bohaiensis]|uniref:enoyl-CoA hydratase n=1 Tax=Marinobacter bohaiensis TaxID=2201898 RepID=UPI000DABFBE2|nr:enoyl-CoA hydratase [Marinobacter bohaiensis]